MLFDAVAMLDSFLKGELSACNLQFGSRSLHRGKTESIAVAVGGAWEVSDEKSFPFQTLPARSNISR